MRRKGVFPLSEAAHVSINGGRFLLPFLQWENISALPLLLGTGRGLCSPSAQSNAFVLFSVLFVQFQKVLVEKGGHLWASFTGRGVSVTGEA